MYRKQSSLVHQFWVKPDVLHAARDLVRSKFNLHLDIRLRFLIQPMLLIRHLCVGSSQLMADDLLLQFRVTATGSLNAQLDVATSIDKPEQERSLVNSVTNSDKAVIHEERGLPIGTKSLGNVLALLLGGDDAEVLVINSECTIEVADVLGDHVKRLSKCTPRAASDGVSVADGVDVSTDLVDLGVDEEARIV